MKNTIYSVYVVVVGLRMFLYDWVQVDSLDESAVGVPLAVIRRNSVPFSILI